MDGPAVIGYARIIEGTAVMGCARVMGSTAIIECARVVGGTIVSYHTLAIIRYTFAYIVRVIYLVANLGNKKRGGRHHGPTETEHTKLRERATAQTHCVCSVAEATK